MINSVDLKIEKWKQKLLDLGKRNRLINFKETRRSNISIVRPDMKEVYDSIATQNKTLEFALVDDQVNLFNFDSVDERAPKIKIDDFKLNNGQILTNRSDIEMLKTIAQIKNKAKTALEEQGVNILYLAFGFLEWNEIENSKTILKSPIILVPVHLTLESMLDPYCISMTDDDIVVNPTLAFKLERDFNIILQELSDTDDLNIKDYLNRIQDLVSANKWRVSKEVHLSLFSFLKLNMYEDLNKNSDKVVNHAIIKALAGDRSELKPIPNELKGLYDHDSMVRPIDTFQVVDADSSQQDAVIAAKKGVSFVLQGPPGTGKSQTITNIIAECLADGKKVLFVSGKMAALDVVYKRIKESGFTDFCLQLHSNKANKKEVLAELGRTLNLPKNQIRDEAIAELEQLLEDRKQLNEYEWSLHVTCDPLNKTIYEIHGRLLRYQNAPDLVFDFMNVSKITQNDLHRIERLLDQFARTADKMGVDYASNPWSGCNLSNFTLEFQHNTMTHFRALEQNIRELGDICAKLDSALGLVTHTTLEQAIELKGLLGIAAKSTKPPVAWIKSHELQPLMTKAEDYLSATEEYKKIKGEVLSRYSNQILDLPTDALARRLEDGFCKLSKEFVPEILTLPDGIIEQRHSILGKIESLVKQVEELRAVSLELADELGVKSATSLLDILALSKLVSNILQDPKPLESWFDEQQFIILRKVFEETRLQYEKRASHENILLSEFDRDILDLEFAPILMRVRDSYNSALKYFKPSYYQDRKTFHNLSRNPSKKYINTDLLNYLQMLKERSEINAWIAENKCKAIEFLGAWFNDDYTDWNRIVEAINAFTNIMAFFAHEIMPEKTKRLLMDSETSKKHVKQIHERLVEILTKVETINNASSFIKLDVAIQNIDLSELHAKSIFLRDTFIETFGALDSITQCSVTTNTLTFDAVIADIEKVSQIHKTDKSIDAQSLELNDLFGHYFNGIETNWNTILNSLGWTSVFKSAVQQLELSDHFIDLICSNDDFINAAERGVHEIDDVLLQIEPEKVYLKSLFDDEYKNRFEQMDFTFMSIWLHECMNNFGGLEEWIDFRHSREVCIEEGLGDFVTNVIEKKIPIRSIKAAFLKRFYRLWLDVMYTHFPAISSFRRRNHETIIEDFTSLDKRQLLIARARIREILSAKLPTNSSMNTGRGEIDILRRELGKRRRIMPLRKLFKNIPNLLQVLKPCLMMSPLSVSMFLDPDVYKFDIAIFDEASQICPEDAIGAIYRAEQIIIAGDSEQLPPTNFFTANTGDSEFDDDDDDDGEAFESILDEARSVLSDKSLRWHYRSKHEHLINFSNVKIYAKNHNSLITFPSCIDGTADNGVEYIYLPNGIYDRSGSRTNKLEAQRIAELIFEHFNVYPKRSLGIVTFSEAQRNQVDFAVRHLREKQPQFERFFDESKEEAFFIKNLENVQGDERDTIIFGIGYAKDQNGIMHMNFGPLSKEGGYRRLNVAITRAKYNVKLVGSIKPTDIDLERTSSDGVKMLRAYIDYAINGPDSLLNEIIEPENIYTESPFEEEVYIFLRDKGYRIATQVGCSGYRIDMAVKHATISGKYLLGIECDGATYHSARTARERDRLRSDVLRMRGWELYRIWSTDWIKDPASESQRLINAIENAINNAEHENYEKDPDPEPPTMIEKEEMLDSISVEINPGEIEANNLNVYGFTKYQVAEVYDIERFEGESDIVYLAKVIKHVADIESPIHFDLLCKRLTPLFGNQKTTAPIRRMVTSTLNIKLRNRISIIDEFCWTTANTEVRARISDDDEKRKIEYICKEELAEAMYSIVESSFGITIDDLFIETARVFGFNRTGERIRIALLNALNYLLDSGRACDNDGKVSIRN